MVTRKLRSSGPELSALGLGCMGMSGMYGPPDEDESIATIQAAIERAVPPDAAAGDRYAEAQMAHLDSERSTT